jgi:hypothetical protein
MVGWNVRPLQLVAHWLITDKCFYLCFSIPIYGIYLLCIKSEF